MTITQHNIGQQLKSARTSAGLSVDQLAAALCLSKDKLELLEKNQFDMLSAPTYVAGYIRSYCKQVNIDHKPLLEAYHQSHEAKEPALTSTSNQPAQMSAKDPRFITMTIVILLVLLVLIAIWAWESFKVQEALLDKNPPLPIIESVFDEESQASQANITDESNIESSLITGEESVQTDAESVEESVIEEVAALNDVTEEVIEANDTVATQINSLSETIKVEQNGRAPVGSDSVIIIVTEQSWVNVKDANGYRLYYNMLNPSQSPYTLIGTAPFDVVLGDASVVELSINSRIYDVRRYMRADKSARFSVK